jgi:hypothetical protein
MDLMEHFSMPGVDVDAVVVVDAVAVAVDAAGAVEWDIVQSLVHLVHCSLALVDCRPSMTAQKLGS